MENNLSAIVFHLRKAGFLKIGGVKRAGSTAPSQIPGQEPITPWNRLNPSSGQLPKPLAGHIPGGSYLPPQGQAMSSYTPPPTFMEDLDNAAMPITRPLGKATDWIRNRTADVLGSVSDISTRSFRGGPSSPFAGVLPALRDPFNAKYHLTRNRTGLAHEDYRSPGAPSPEVRNRQMKALAAQNNTSKDQENMLDFGAGFFMESENPENWLANYTLPFIPIGGYSGATGGAAKMRGAISGGLSKVRQGYNAVKDTIQSRRVLPWIWDTGLPGAGRLLWEKGKMIPSGAAIETTYTGAKNVFDPARNAPNGEFTVSDLLRGNPVYKPFTEGKDIYDSFTESAENALWYTTPKYLKKYPALAGWTAFGSDKLLNRPEEETQIEEGNK